MIRPILIAASALLLSACAGTGLDSLLLEGPELHESLAPRAVDDVPLHVSGSVLRENPQVSSHPDFIEIVARGGSQGRLGGKGFRTALYGIYEGESGIGIYGLEASTLEDADRREVLIRDIWAMNASVDRTRVHRAGKILVVVWSYPDTPSYWEAANAVVAERLEAR